MCSGLRACLNSGRYGSAKTVATVEHSFLKMVIYPKNFKKNGRTHTKKELESNLWVIVL
jgi:ribosomal protein L30E